MTVLNMLIAIDGYEANEKSRVGVGRYAFEILKQMFQEVKSQKLKGKSKENIEFVIYLPDEPSPDMPAETDWWKYRVAGPKKFWTFVGLPLALASDPRPDVIFSPTHYTPRFLKIPRVFSIMDLSYLEYPEMFRPKDLHQLVNWTKYSVQHAARILTISRFSKNAIIKAYGISPERIVVTYPGLFMNSKVKSEKSKLTDQYKLSEHYILSVGTLQPRKNYVRLIEAFSVLTGDLPKQYCDLTLVIVGKRGWLFEEILAAPARYGVSERVKFLDFVDDRDLPELYRSALCLAMPSLYEGFGLPVLEAMANKTPVVVSEVSSLPEIAGKAGIYIKPDDVGSIAAGLKLALKEHGTAKSKERVKSGLSQSAKFTWENAAKKTLEILEDVGRLKGK